MVNASASSQFPALQVQLETHAGPQACRTSAATFTPVENLIPAAAGSRQDVELDDSYEAEIAVNGSYSNLIQDDFDTLSSLSARLDRRSSSPEAVTSTPALNSSSSTRLDRHSSSSEAIGPTADDDVQDVDSSSRPTSSEAENLPSSSNSEPTDNARLDRRSTPVLISATPAILALSNACDARLDQRSGLPLTSVRTSPSGFPDFKISTLPSWLQNPISLLLKNFGGEKELQVVRGLVALEQKWGKVSYQN